MILSVVSNSYYTFSIAYSCNIVFTARGPWGACPGGHAVKYAICYWERVVCYVNYYTTINKIAHENVQALSSQEDISARFSSYDNCKSFQMLTIRQRQRGHHTDQQVVQLDLEDYDIEDMCRGFMPKNTVADTACDFSRAGGRPKTCIFQATKCLQTFCFHLLHQCCFTYNYHSAMWRTTHAEEGRGVY